MKLLNNLMSKSVPSREQLISWLKWLDSYCKDNPCIKCKYSRITDYSSRCCSIPDAILFAAFDNVSANPIPPQEPPHNIREILNGVNFVKIVTLGGDDSK